VSGLVSSTRIGGGGSNLELKHSVHEFWKRESSRILNAVRRHERAVER
jgi:hypothetical protein